MGRDVEISLLGILCLLAAGVEKICDRYPYGVEKALLDHAGDLSEPLVQDLLYGFMLLIILCEEADGVAVAPAADPPLPPPDLIQDPFKILVDLDPHSELLDADVAPSLKRWTEIDEMMAIRSFPAFKAQDPRDYQDKRVAELHGSISLLELPQNLSPLII